jgi:HNH endonuclease
LGYNCYEKRATIVLEQKLGRKLLPGEIAHHIDEDRANDHPDNLELKLRGQHQAENARRGKERGIYEGSHIFQPRGEDGRFK